MGRKLSVIRNPKNLKPGMKFNRLTIIERVSRDHKENPYQYAAWKCQCECGKINYVSTYNLINGVVKSCGCLRSEINKKVGKKSIVKLHTLIKEGKVIPSTKRMRTKKCTECGKTFEGNYNKLTCSPECAKERTKRLNKENHRRQYERSYTSIKVYCPRCGKKIPINKEYCKKCSEELSKLGTESYTLNSPLAKK